jgi:hypothetical protein
MALVMVEGIKVAQEGGLIKYLEIQEEPHGM